MRRSIQVGLSLAACVATTATAGTFTPKPIAPEAGVDAVTRGVARAQLGKSVFSNPYATVTLGAVDVYDRFPYVESRRFQIVSDPAWNRLVLGEIGKSLSAYDGHGRPWARSRRRAGSRWTSVTASTSPTRATTAWSCCRP